MKDQKQDNESLYAAPFNDVRIIAQVNLVARLPDYAQSNHSGRDLLPSARWCTYLPYQKQNSEDVTKGYVSRTSTPETIIQMGIEAHDTS